MTSDIKTFGQPSPYSIHTKLLQPKLSHSFQVVFEGKHNEILSNQIVDISHSGDFFIMNFDDDIHNFTIKQLLNLTGKQVKFKILSLNGNDETLATWLYEGTLVVFTPSFNYAESKTHKLVARFKISTWNVEV